MDSCADPWLFEPLVCGPPVPCQPKPPDTAVKDKIEPAAPTNVPPARQRVELSAESIGFTLRSDDETIRDIERMQEEAVKAAQDVKKFALR